jgi:hypothetical protein
MRRIYAIAVGSIFGIIIVTSIILAFITDSDTTPIWTSYTEPEVYRALVDFDSNHLSNQFETFMYRDFMPICPPGGRDLVLIIILDSLTPDCIQRV